MPMGGYLKGARARTPDGQGELARPSCETSYKGCAVVSFCLSVRQIVPCGRLAFCDDRHLSVKKNLWLVYYVLRAVLFFGDACIWLKKMVLSILQIALLSLSNFFFCNAGIDTRKVYLSSCSWACFTFIESWINCARSSKIYFDCFVNYSVRGCSLTDFIAVTVHLASLGNFRSAIYLGRTDVQLLFLLFFFFLTTWLLEALILTKRVIYICC